MKNDQIFEVTFPKIAGGVASKIVLGESGDSSFAWPRARPAFVPITVAWPAYWFISAIEFIDVLGAICGGFF
jgi:hypothetical protein